MLIFFFRITPSIYLIRFPHPNSLLENAGFPVFSTKGNPAFSHVIKIPAIVLLWFRIMSAHVGV